MPLWIAGKLDAPGLESWQAFRERVRAACAASSKRPSQPASRGVYLRRTRSASRSRRVLRSARATGHRTELAHSQLLAHRVRFHARSDIARQLQFDAASHRSDFPMNCYTKPFDPMKIHEYQAKAILAKYDVPVPRGEVAFTVDEAEAAAKKTGRKRGRESADSCRRPRQGRRREGGQGRRGSRRASPRRSSA